MEHLVLAYAQVDMDTNRPKDSVRPTVDQCMTYSRSSPRIAPFPACG